MLVKFSADIEDLTFNRNGQVHKVIERFLIVYFHVLTWAYMVNFYQNFSDEALSDERYIKSFLFSLACGAMTNQWMYINFLWTS